MIERPADEVFRILVDVANLAAWNPTIKGARKLSEGPPREGTQFEMDVEGFGPVPQTLEEVRENVRVRYVPHFKVMSGGHRFLLTAAGGQTKVDHELEMRPKGLYVFMSPLLGMVGRKNLRRTAVALKNYVEAQSTGPGR